MYSMGGMRIKCRRLRHVSSIMDVQVKLRLWVQQRVLGISCGERKRKVCTAKCRISNAVFRLCRLSLSPPNAGCKAVPNELRN